MNLIMQNNSMELANLKSKDYPFYAVTYDPFNVTKRWSSALKDIDFRDTLETLVGLNKRFIESGSFNSKLFSKKRLFRKDICLQSCLLSYMEIFRAQKQVVDLTKMMDSQTLTNFGSLFEGYGTRKKRTFHNSMIFTLSWFNQLMHKYEKEGWSTRDYFRDFMRLGDGNKGSYEGIRQDVIGWGGVLGLYLPKINFVGGGELIIDFNQGEIQYNTRDNFMPGITGDGSLNYFSEVLERDNPFQDRDRLNFMLPIGYRGHVLPLINVNKIQIQKNNGDVVIYSKDSLKLLN